MEAVDADIELINEEDRLLASKNIIAENEVKRMHIKALVDNKITMFCINEKIQELLKFPFSEKRKALLADGQIVECPVVGPVEVRFKNRRSTCRAMVLPGDCQPVLGLILFADMDVLIHPQRQELIVNPEHAYFAQMKLK